MIKIRILSVGKTKEKWLLEALEEYTQRLAPWATVEGIWAKDDQQLETFAKKESSYICLEPEGKMLTSEEFAQFFQKKMIEGDSRLTFLIGGPEGIPKNLKQVLPLSLSRMTFTHQMARLLLLEQIYRSFTILSGLPYHK